VDKNTSETNYCMDQLTIRKVEPQDFENIYHFVNELEEEVFDKIRQRQIFMENIENPNYFYLIATLGDKAVGFLTCHAQHLLHHSGLIGEIHEMYIEPQHRSLGIGQKLIDFLIFLAQSKNVTQLEVTSSKHRKKALHFYQSVGFVHTHRKFVFNLNGKEQID
jgi:PhnO protein